MWPQRSYNRVDRIDNAMNITPADDSACPSGWVVHWSGEVFLARPAEGRRRFVEMMGRAASLAEAYASIREYEDSEGLKTTPPANRERDD